MFTADLMREIDNPVRLDCIRVSSYGAKTKSIGTPQVIYSLTLDIKGTVEKNRVELFMRRVLEES